MKLRNRLFKTFILLTMSIFAALAVISFTACGTTSSPDPAPQKYTVTFETNGGGNIPAQSVQHGKTAAEPDAPEREGYFFVCWCSDEELENEFEFTAKITANITLYAKWEPKSGGDDPVTPPVDPEKPGGEDPVTPPDDPDDPDDKPVTPPVDPDDPDDPDDKPVTPPVDPDDPDDKPVTPPVTQKFTVSFAVDGREYDKITVEANSKATAPTAPAKEGHTFAGWFATDDAPFDFDTPITQDLILTAKWNVNYYTVTFISAGGSSVPSQYVKHGSCAAAPSDPVKAGYALVGWNDGSSQFDFATPVTSDLTLTAEWKPDTSTVYCTVTFDSNGGNGVPAQLVVKGNAAAEPAQPAKAGYTFAGWFTDSDLSQQYDFGNAVAGDITLFAKWTAGEPVRYVTVNFESNGGSSVSAQYIASGNPAAEPAEPRKDGFTFAGWYYDEELTKAFNFVTTVTSDITLYAGWEENTEPEKPVEPETPSDQYRWENIVIDFNDSKYASYGSDNKPQSQIEIDGITYAAGVYFENKNAGLKLDYGNINTQSKSPAITFTLNGDINKIGLTFRLASSTATVNLYIYKVTDSGDVQIFSALTTTSAQTVTIETDKDGNSLTSGTYYIGTVGGSARIGNVVFYEGYSV